MAKAGKAGAKKDVPPADAKSRSKEEVEQVENQVRNVILGNSVEMTRRVVESVTGASHITALKFLWQTAGLFPARESTEEDESPDVLAKILLERMGLDEENPEEGEKAGGDVESEE